MAKTQQKRERDAMKTWRIILVLVMLAAIALRLFVPSFGVFPTIIEVIAGLLLLGKVAISSN